MTSSRGLLAVLAAAVLAAGSLAACGDDDSSGLVEADAEADAVGRSKPEVEVPDDDPPDQLVIEDLVEGEGAEVGAGDTVVVEYVGVAWSDGEEFDSSWERDPEFSFTLGAGGVIPGWERGVEGMRVGGRRRLEIPPHLAYGPQGYPPVIAPDETLVFVIDLIAVR